VNQSKNGISFPNTTDLSPYPEDESHRLSFTTDIIQDEQGFLRETNTKNN
jgi:hypothetical protein